MSFVCDSYCSRDYNEDTGSRVLLLETRFVSGVLFLICCICLLVCTYVIDDTHFEQHSEQDFGDEQQQQFEEGKCPLIIFCPKLFTIYSHLLYYMHESII